LGGGVEIHLISWMLLIIGIWKKIENLMGPGGLVCDTPGILEIASKFYKDLFRKESRCNFSLQANFWDPKDLVFEEENIALQAPFLEKEVVEAVFSCYLEGAPRPDGLPFLFLQKFWGW
jgi:hypothetical protein